MRIHDILRRKGDTVVTVSPDASVSDLLSHLADHGIGACVVARPDGSLAGIVSERDVVRALHQRGAEVLAEPISAIMTTELHTCGPDDDLESLARTMTEQRIRHLPVIADGRMLGIVSIGDIVKNRIAELQDEKDFLVDYIQH